ncbi:hypothetical protein N7U49_32240 [Streptomyces sp. AD2-2]|nr:hypothetical protein N7U49_32240 [Streptomyces sp. AD2-2]
MNRELLENRSDSLSRPDGCDFGREVEYATSNNGCLLDFPTCKIGIREPGQVQGFVPRVCVIGSSQDRLQDGHCPQRTSKLSPAPAGHDAKFITVHPGHPVGLRCAVALRKRSLGRIQGAFCLISVASDGMSPS